MLAPVAGSILLGIACTISHMGWDGGQATLPALLAVGKSASLFSIYCADWKDSVRKSLAISGLLMLGLAVGGCASLMVASVEGSVDLAAYEYASPGTNGSDTARTAEAVAERYRIVTWRLRKENSSPSRYELQRSVLSGIGSAQRLASGKKTPFRQQNSMVMKCEI